MQSLKNRIEDLIGSITDHANIGENAIIDFLEASVKDGADKLPSPMLIPYAKTTNFTANQNTASIANTRLLLVVRNDGSDDIESIEKPINLKSKVSDSQSIHNASVASPAHIRGVDGKITIYPEDTGHDGTVYYYPYPAVELGQSYIGAAHGEFPETAHYAVILGAAMKCLQNIINNLTHAEEDIELAQATQGELASLQNLYQLEMQRFIG